MFTVLWILRTSLTFLRSCVMCYSALMTRVKCLTMPTAWPVIKWYVVHPIVSKKQVNCCHLTCLLVSTWAKDKQPATPLLHHEKLKHCRLCKKHYEDSLQTLGPTRLLSNGYRGLLPRDKSGLGVKMNTHLHLVPKSRMRRTIPPLPQYFMASYLIKRRDMILHAETCFFSNMNLPFL
jgi:hypothetical protein